MQSYYTKIAREGSIVFSSEAIFRILNFLTGILVIRTLGASNYGIYNLGTSVLLIVGTFGSLGLEDALIRQVSYYMAKKDIGSVKSIFQLVAKYSLIVSFFLTGLLIAFSKIIAVKIFHNSELQIIIIILATAYPAARWIGLTSGYFNARKTFWISSFLNNILTSLIKLIFAVILFVFSLGIIEWSLAYTISLCIVAIIAIFIFKQKAYNKIKHVESAKLKIAPILKFSLPIGCSQILISLETQVNLLLLGYFRVAAEVGIFSVYLLFTQLIMMAAGSLAGVFYPVFTEMVANQNLAAMQDIYQRITKWFHMITITGGLILLTIGIKIIPLIAGKSYDIEKPTLLYLLVLGIMMSVITGPDGIAIKSLGWSRFLIIISLSSFLARLLFGYFLIPEFGMNGAAASNLIGICISHGIGTLIIKRNLKIKLFSKESALLLRISLGFIFYLIAQQFLFDLNETIIINIILIVIFLLILSKSRIIDAEDKIIFSKIREKLIGLAPVFGKMMF